MSKFVIFAIICCIFFGCASSGKGTASAQSVQDDAIQIAKSTDTADSREFQDIDRLYKEKKYQDVITKSSKFGKKHSDSQFIGQVFHVKALSAIALKQYTQAQTDLKKVIDYCKSGSGNENLMAMAQFNLAFIFFETGQTDNAIKYLDMIDLGILTKPNRAKYHLLKSKSLRLNADYFRSADEAYLALKEDPDTFTKGFSSFLDELLDKLESTTNGLSQLELLLSKHDDSIHADKILFRSANLQLKQGNAGKAKSYFEKIVTKYPNSPHAGTAQSNLIIAEGSSQVDRDKIGVIVTLSGKFGKFGQRTLQGLELAFKVFNNKVASNSPTLVVYDDQGDVDRATAAIEELYYKHHVVAVIGPISSKLVEPLSKKAELLGVPLISLSQKDVMRQPGPDSYVFSAGLTPSMQSHELIRYANDKANIKDIAILSPSSKFGEEYTKTFWDELDRKGMIVRGFETYPDDETDFRIYIDKLVGLNAQEARSTEINELNQLKNAAFTKLKTKSKKLERLFTLKPIIDFQAVFIPDEPRLLGQILPTFAYRDVDNMLFLGINTWNSSELVARASQFASGSVFVDGFFARSMKPSVQKFIDEYRKTFSVDPILMDALAFDAATILEHLLGKNSSVSRSELREKLYNLKDFPGLSGPIQSQDGRLLKTLHFLTLKGGKIEEIAF